MLLNALFAWLGMMVLAIANGAFREGILRRRLSERTAHQASTLLLLLLFSIYFRVIATIWPLRSAAEAWTVGFFWLALTLAFEFGFGRWIAGHSWQRLWADYDLLAGRTWVLIPLWVLLGPVLFLYHG